MGISRLPNQWQSAFARDSVEKPAHPDPLPEHRVARLLAAYIVTGLFFMILPGAVLGRFGSPLDAADWGQEQRK